jgi:hypothetical protein
MERAGHASLNLHSFRTLPFSNFILLNNFFSVKRKKKHFIIFGLLNAQVYKLHDIFLPFKRNGKK